jgi:hypothetical protein
LYDAQSLGAGQQATITLKNLAASPLQAEYIISKGKNLPLCNRAMAIPRTELSLNTSGMPSGMYLLRVTQDSSQLTRKLYLKIGYLIAYVH